MSDEHKPYDFDDPEEQKKRAHCAAFGHLTLNHLEVSDGTHGTKHVCLRCGKFWHGEPTPAEIKNDDRGV